MTELDWSAPSRARAGCRFADSCRDADAIAVSAVGLIDASPAVVFEFLADLRNHHVFTDRYLQLESLSPDEPGGRIVVRGPFWVRRRARTTVTSLRAPEHLGGTALVGSRTRAAVDWRIAPAPGGARLELSATVTEAAIGDRLLLALGGRWWLARRMRLVVARLAAALERDPEAGVVRA